MAAPPPRAGLSHRLPRRAGGEDPAQKIRHKGLVQNRAVYVAVGVGADGHKDVLGLWIQTNEGAKFWLAILDELKRRGVQDILVLCADGLTGLPQAVAAAFPRTIFQTCIVHMVRSSTRFVPWKERRAVCADLRKVYNADDVEHAAAELDAFEAAWGERFPMIANAWRERWNEVTPFLAFPAEVRRAIYTTNAIEALHRIMRKTLKTRGHMPNDEAAPQALVPRHPKCKEEMGATPPLMESGSIAVRHSLRGPDPRMTLNRRCPTRKT